MKLSTYDSVQHYPNIYCFGPTAANTNISNYLTHTTGKQYPHSLSIRIDHLYLALSSRFVLGFPVRRSCVGDRGQYPRHHE